MKFIVRTHETWVQEYEVEAPDPETAKERVRQGEASAREDSFEFCDTHDSSEWKVRPALDQTENPWLLKEPRTPDQQAEFRKAMTGIPVDVPAYFTCDDCGLAGVCKLAFDGYNVGGDCLYDK